MMILLAALLATMPLTEWNGLSEENRQRFAFSLGTAYLQNERDCSKVRITAGIDGETVLFDAECVEVKKTNL